MQRLAGAGSVAIQRAPPRRLGRPMPSKTLALAVILSAAALASPSDFRLPTERPQQEPPPDLQGPVAPDVPASRRPPTPTPTTSRTETPAPAASPPPVEVPAALQTQPSANPTRRAVMPAPTSAAPTTATSAATTGLPQPEPST